MPLPNMREPRPGQVTRLAEGPTTDSQSTTWRREAATVLQVLGRTGTPFTVQDLSMLVGNPPNVKQLGSAFASAARQHHIEVVGAALVGGRLVRVWRGTT
jgi:hypothetical protein